MGLAGMRVSAQEENYKHDEDLLAIDLFNRSFFSLINSQETLILMRISIAGKVAIIMRREESAF